MSSQGDNMYTVHERIITGIAFKFAEDIIQLRTPFSVEWRSLSFGILCVLRSSQTQHNKLGNLCIAQLMHPLSYVNFARSLINSVKHTVAKSVKSSQSY
jgi:hypothetical protein